MPNKAQFVELLAEKLDGDKKKAQDALNAMIQTVYQAVVKGEKVVLTGFGVFEKRDRAARIARNPATGASVKVKKTSVPAFRPGAEFKAITSGAKKLAKAPAKRVATVKTAAAKTLAKKTPPAKAPAVKSAAAKTLAKKTPATKTPATKAATKTAPTKATPSKATASKATASKATASKATKAPAKKAAKAPAKK